MHAQKKEQEAAAAAAAAAPPKTWDVPKKAAVPTLFEAQQRERAEQQQLEMQEMELRQRMQEKLALETPAEESVGSAWGAAPVAAVVTGAKQSLQQIQAEQERLEQEQALRGADRKSVV